MKIFKNSNREMRSGWKIGIVYLSYFITTFLVSIIFSSLYEIILAIKNPKLASDEINFINYLNEQFSSMSHLPAICLYLFQCITMIIFVIFFWKLWDNGKLKYIGLTSINKSWKDLCIGLLIGSASFTLVAVTLLLTKSVMLVNSLNHPAFSLGLIIQLIIFIFVGFNEEFFARGYCMTVLKQTKISWVPILISAFIFALMHSLNRGISFIAYANLFLFGIVMGYMYIKNRNIWMCIGYHITWNYFQGNIFGFLVSGNSTESIYNVKITDYNIINGGNFGPEGGIVVTILLIITIYLIHKFLPARRAEQINLM